MFVNYGACRAQSVCVALFQASIIIAKQADAKFVLFYAIFRQSCVAHFNENVQHFDVITVV